MAAGRNNGKISLTAGMIIACLVTTTADAQDGTHVATHASHQETDTRSTSPKEFNAESAYTISQQAIGTKIDNHSLTDSVGNAVRLHDLLGAPLVISMVYTSCYHICPTLTRHLANVVEIGRDALGQNAFSVLTVGFDTAVDSPRQMALFAAERGIQDPKWRFVSANESTITALSRELGFSYQPSPQGFDHITQTSVLDGSGVLTNQVYGVNFDAPLLVEPLKHNLRGQVFEANTVEGWWREVKLLCTVYDPASGRYHFDYSLIVAVVMGLVCLSLVAVFVIRAWRSSRRLEITP